MPTYYCDLGQDYADQTGADKIGNELYGVGGLMAAFRGTGAATALAADDTLFIKGTGLLARLVNITIADTTGWLITHEVRNAVGAGDDWTGVICEVIDGTHILVELDSGKTLANVNFNDNVENTTIADTEAASAVTALGLQHDGASGNMGAGTPIKVTGVNSSWANDGTRILLDGGNETTYILALYTIQSYIWENIEFHDPTTHCVSAVAGSCYYHEWVNCSFNTGTYGVWLEAGSPYYYQFTGCTFHTCTTYGTRDTRYSNWVACVVHDCGVGLYPSYGGAVVDCLIYDNTTGIFCVITTLIAHCTFNGNTFDVDSQYGPTTIVACRMSNYTTDAIKVSGTSIRDLYCYFDDDANHDDGGNEITSDFKGSSTRIITGIAGHQDRANKKFMVGIGAGGYRTEFEIATDHVLRFCPGLPTMQLPRTGKSGGKQ